MAVEHRNIPESGLHEPKGASTAASNRVYISDGAGSGSWSQVDANALQGTVNNSSPDGLRVITDGEGGFRTEPTPASSFGTINLTGNTTTKAVSAATDSTLRTENDYTALDISFQFDNLVNMDNGANSLILEANGLYLIDFWANVAAGTNASKFSLRFVVDDTDFVPRGPKLTLGTAGQFYNMSANGIHQFTAGEELKLYIACDKSTDITIEDMTFQIVYLGV